MQSITVHPARLASFFCSLLFLPPSTDRTHRMRKMRKQVIIKGTKQWERKNLTDIHRLGPSWLMKAFSNRASVGGNTERERMRNEISSLSGTTLHSFTHTNVLSPTAWSPHPFRVRGKRERKWFAFQGGGGRVSWSWRWTREWRWTG